MRYFAWLGNAICLNLGNSYNTGAPVGEMLFHALGYTLQLVGSTILTVIFFSFFFGILCAIWAGRTFDGVTRVLMYIISAMPAYWIGTLSIWLFSNVLHWLPTSGVGTFSNFIMPTFILAIGYFTFYFRVIRNSMLENIHKNYVLFLRSSGVRERKIIKHILRNSLQTAVSGFCMAIPGMLAGSVVIENVFAWPGIGRLCVNAIFARDIPIIQGYVLMLAMLYCCFNLIADLINAALNPRLRRG